MKLESSVDDLHVHTGAVYLWHTTENGVRYQYRYFVYSDVMYVFIPDIQLPVPVHYTGKVNSTNIRDCKQMLKLYTDVDKSAFMLDALHRLVEKNKKLDNKFNNYIDKRYRLNILAALSIMKPSLDGYGFTDYYYKILNNNPNIFSI